MQSKKIKDTKKQSQQKVLNRIARLEGQLKGVRRMVEKKEECVDIITQITAIREAVSMLGSTLLKDDFACRRKEKKEISEAYLKTLFRIK